MKIFISYSRKDAAFRDRLFDALKTAEFEVIYDLREIEPGDKFEARIVDMIEEAAVAVVIWSVNSAKSDYVKIEARLAIDQFRYLPIQAGPRSLPDEFSDRDVLVWSIDEIGDAEFVEQLTPHLMRVAAEPRSLSPKRERIRNELSRREAIKFVGALLAGGVVGQAAFSSEINRLNNSLNSRNIADIASFLSRATSSQLTYACSHFFHMIAAERSVVSLIDSANNVATSVETARLHAPTIKDLGLCISNQDFTFDARHTHRVRALPHMLAAQLTMTAAQDDAAEAAERVFQDGDDPTLIEIIAQNLLCGARPVSGVIEPENFQFLARTVRRLTDVALETNSSHEVTPSLFAACLNIIEAADARGDSRTARLADDTADWIIARDPLRGPVLSQIREDWHTVRRIAFAHRRQRFVLPELSMLVMQRDIYLSFLRNSFPATCYEPAQAIIDAFESMRAWFLFRKCTDGTGIEQAQEQALDKIAGFYGHYGYFKRLHGLHACKPELFTLYGQRDFDAFLTQAFDRGVQPATIPEVQTEVSSEALIDFVSAPASTHAWAPIVAKDKSSRNALDRLADRAESRAAGRDRSAFVKGAGAAVIAGFGGAAVLDFLNRRSAELTALGLSRHPSDTEITDALVRIARAPREHRGS